MEDDPPPEVAIQQLTIDPEGDVHLSLRDCELLVSSKVLSLASPVFKKLFGPHFLEGNRVEAKNPGHVDLHEDDSEAMTSLCYLLHYQMDKAPDNPTPDFLDSLTILADKYDCVRSISQWTCFKLYVAVRQAEQSMSDGRLLFPAYVFGNPQVFREITKHMVYSINIDISSLSTSSLPELYRIPNEVAAALPDGLLSKMCISSIGRMSANLCRHIGMQANQAQGQLARTT